MGIYDLRFLICDLELADGHELDRFESHSGEIEDNRDESEPA